MLSVVESAEILQVTPTRVRALIAQGALPAQKVGRTWTLREEDVMFRPLQTTASRTQQQASSIAHAKTIWQRARALPR